MFKRTVVWGSVLLGIMLSFGAGYWTADSGMLIKYRRPSRDPWIRNVRTGEEFWGQLRLQGAYRVTDSPRKTWEVIITPRHDHNALCRYRFSGNEQRVITLRGIRFGLQVVREDVVCVNRAIDQYVAY